MRGPWDGKQGPSRGFPIRLPGYGIFIFGVPKLLFFVKQLQGAHLSIARDLRVVVGDLLRTTSYAPPITCHMCALAIWESLRLPAVSRRIRWKLTGFELGVHFPSLKKFLEKCF